MDLNPSLLAKVRENPSLYMSPGRRPAVEDIAVELASDAIYLGSNEVTVARQDDWTFVGASTDWLAKGSRWTPEECFFRLEFINEYRPNANRATLLVGAFASDIALFIHGSASAVVGSDSGLAALSSFAQAHPLLVQIVGFRVPSAA